MYLDVEDGGGGRGWGSPSTSLVCTGGGAKGTSELSSSPSIVLLKQGF
jgi:hypothetical protein